MKYLLSALIALVVKIFKRGGGCSGGVCAPVLACVLALFCGCRSGNYLEGTSLSLGLLVPTSDGLVGVQVCEYINGAKISIGTNTPPFTVSRTHSSTNSYFKLVDTQESTTTEIEVKP